ncbi:hypothetical protein, partial [uncultured Clostridium sp.]|uniref:hypothetical protein n=1 Tax=uncultured Clostridium sp. TaxID=59620 RepID=UPI0034C6424B
IYRHLPTYEKIIRNLVSFFKKKSIFFKKKQEFLLPVGNYTFYIEETPVYPQEYISMQKFYLSREDSQLF